MRSIPIRASLLGAVICLTPMAGLAQTWGAAANASGWAKQDRDDSFTFFDPASKSLHTWTRDGGVMGTIPTGRLEAPPERWVIDPRGNAWVAHGTSLTYLEQSGRTMTSVKLPAEVGDLCWDAKGIILSYRTPEPYLEKRDFRNAEVMWSFGAKPARRGDGPAPLNRRPVILDDRGAVLLASGGTLNLSVLDSNTGQKVGETKLLFKGGPTPALEGNAIDRGPLAVWMGKGVVFAALKASQVPAAQRENLQGLVLARLDLTQTSVEFLPTGLDETHVLVGVLDSEAVFASPRGGLMLVQVK